MAVESFVTYKNYFKDLSDKNKAIAFFVMGDSERIIGMQRSKISYPCLWLESPDISVKDNKSDNVQGDFRGAFNIISHAKTDDYEAQDSAMETNFQIASEVISRMVKDRRGREPDSPMFNLDLSSIVMLPINSMMIDNDFGWRVEFLINNNLNFCYDSTKWNS
jgi:hypothetical protein